MNQNIKAIPYSRPELGSEEEEAVLRVLRSGWLTTGKEALAFEASFAERINSAQSPAENSAKNSAKNSAENPAQKTADSFSALAVNSATAGLHLSLHALNLPPGAGVLLSPYTFAASINTILYNGLVPILIDTEAGGYHMDPVKAADYLANPPGGAPAPGAIMAVNFAGHDRGTDELLSLARKHGIALIEDAAHSFPGRRTGGGYQGTAGDAGVFSFYANKNITTGEGGMIITPHADMAKQMKTLRLHGISRDVWDRYTSTGIAQNGDHSTRAAALPSEETQRPHFYDVVAPGYKYNMPDILAAIGRVQLEKADALMISRRRVAAAYVRSLGDRDWCTMPPGSELALAEGPEALTHSWHIFSLRLRTDRLSISRDEFINKMTAAGVGSSVHFIPLHIMSYYRDRFGFSPNSYPNAMESSLATISLPIFPGLTDMEVQRVIDEVANIGDTYYQS